MDPRHRRIYVNAEAKEDMRKNGFIPVQIKRWILHALRQNGAEHLGPDYMIRWREIHGLEIEDSSALLSNSAYRQQVEYQKKGRKSVSNMALSELGIDL